MFSCTLVYRWTHVLWQVFKYAVLLKPCMVYIPVVQQLITQLEISMFDGMKEIRGKYLNLVQVPHSLL